MTEKKMMGYYDEIDIELEETLLRSGFVDEVFYLKDLQQRKMYLTDEISQATVTDIIRHIMQINREDMGLPIEIRKPIILYISSKGGDERSGYGLIDAIENSATPVYTVNIGYEYSMAFLIGLAGHKRFATPNATFLMHDGYNFVMETSTKAQDIMEFNKVSDERIKRYVLSHSKLTEKEYDQKVRVEWYMFSEEAKEKGFTDCIIGQDCPLEEII